mmetsp:Transcript_7438/g.24426  ORF Transcript_7438/g.24426 Transcript_7438/m.24426 type:complete len:378 (+) Transcript_7438:1264-2397(+)
MRLRRGMSPGKTLHPRAKCTLPTARGMGRPRRIGRLIGRFIGRARGALADGRKAERCPASPAIRLPLDRNAPLVIRTRRLLLIVEVQRCCRPSATVWFHGVVILPCRFPNPPRPRKEAIRTLAPPSPPALPPTPSAPPHPTASAHSPLKAPGTRIPRVTSVTLSTSSTPPPSARPPSPPAARFLTTRARLRTISTPNPTAHSSAVPRPGSPHPCTQLVWHPDPSSTPTPCTERSRNKAGGGAARRLAWSRSSRRPAWPQKNTGPLARRREKNTGAWPHNNIGAWPDNKTRPENKTGARAQPDNKTGGRAPRRRLWIRRCTRPTPPATTRRRRSPADRAAPPPRRPAFGGCPGTLARLPGPGVRKTSTGFVTSARRRP